MTEPLRAPGVPLNVALVGYGFVGKVFHAPLVMAVEGLHLHTVVSSNAHAVHADLPQVQVAPTLDAALADAAVDLVVIATPNAVHAAQAHAALDAGKHVVVDKPFTVTVAEAVDVIAHAEAAGRVLSVFHNRRYDSDFLTLRGLVTAGDLGVVTQYESHFDRFRLDVRDRWREKAGPGAGLWYDLGPHLVDQALQLFGMPLGITADIAVQRDGAETDDYFHATLRYPRLRVLLHGSALVAAHDLRFAVHGTRGSFVKQGLDSQEDALKAGRTPGDAHWGVDPRPGTLTRVAGDDLTTRTISGPPGDYRAYYAGVRDAILGAGPNPVPGAEALDVMRLIAAGVQSALARSEIAIA
ncbi:MAG: oxidoreductase [Gemmatimonadaceae bacterium]|nr:oxidoreductase [Gemmatimonadaceae bacterium]